MRIRKTRIVKRIRRCKFCEEDLRVGHLAGCEIGENEFIKNLPPLKDVQPTVIDFSKAFKV